MSHDELYREAALLLLEIKRLCRTGQKAGLARQRYQGLMAAALADPGLADDIVCWRVSALVPSEADAQVTLPVLGDPAVVTAYAGGRVELRRELTTPAANRVCRLLYAHRSQVPGLAVERQALPRAYPTRLANCAQARDWLEKHDAARPPELPADLDLSFTVTSDTSDASGVFHGS